MGTRDDRGLESAFSFINRLDDRTRAEFLSSGNYRKIPSGRILTGTGDSCGNMPFVLSGFLNIFTVGESGRQITLYTVRRGESCVLTGACILSGGDFPATVDAGTDTEAFLIPAPRFRALFEKSPVFQSFILTLYNDRFLRVIRLLLDVRFRKIDERLENYLETASRESGGAVRMTHQQLAERLGSSREVVSRALKDLEERGLISRGRGVIRVTKSQT